MGVPNAQAREFVYDLKDGKRRVVRVVWADGRVYYLAVEGLYLSAERADVRRFLGSFRLTQTKK